MASDVTWDTQGLVHTDDNWRRASELLATAGIQVGGGRPWDIRVHHPATFDRILTRGSLGLGESYMDGWWDCDQLDEFITRILRARLDDQVGRAGWLWASLKARLTNLQSLHRAWQVGEVHYDLGNDLYEAMLDPSMAYSCGYWPAAQTLAQAQEAKLELICQKLQLQPGMKLLDIGCGWGSLMLFAARNYNVECVGLTISKEQARLGAEKARGLPVRFELTDYRQFNPRGEQRFDRIASVGMFEHVGHKNYHAYFDMASRSLHKDGLFLLHTIGKNHAGAGIDPWIEKYIFPNGVLPSVSEIAFYSEDTFVMEDWHNFGQDYDKTLMAWHVRFEAAWPDLQPRYGDRFHRMWRYYLLSCAGTFRARDNQLWQVVLSPSGHAGGYRRPLM
ncbi:cyclopropane-fatty-acyl-phospholipid synthase [Limnohabitans sp. 2KL-17]|uniref:cyclopropane fatty acyl phospholipid synthase n=1 Tax=Limnohabitans sp. 2KL-17 TaxID=1100704 RepID=UPI000D3BA13A|nr:cyclopropane fatty acyl phospholipid synthase [Limnohabitans sp. 2KL-17]PUE62610.1 cyclopropane-fatty-acyl-phospholipid synthase [Limnohabitans sp. 2KL-17]